MSIWVYHLKKCEKNWGSPCWLRSGRPKCKLPSKLRKIIKDTKRSGVKGMNLSAHSNILGNIVNALEMIFNNPKAVNFICQCFQGKNWSIPYLAVCSHMVIPEQIWDRYTFMIFIKFSQNVYMGISFEKCEKNWASPCWLRSGRPKCKLPSQLRKIVKTTKRYGVKAMNLSARSNILGNIINALEMILNHQRAIHFKWHCCQGKTWSIASLAVMCQKCHTLANLGWMYLCDFYTIFRKCYFEYILSKNCDKNWGSPGLFRRYSAKYKQQSQLRKIVNTTRRYVLRKKFLTLSLCWIFSFVDTCRYYWEHISRSFCWTEMINCLSWS